MRAICCAIFSVLASRSAAGTVWLAQPQRIAFDGGAGVRNVEISTDGGATWQEARLDPDLGKYSFRRWRATWTPVAEGDAAVMVRATTATGEVQRATAQWNRAGYMRNVFERVEVKVT